MSCKYCMKCVRHTWWQLQWWQKASIRYGIPTTRLRTLSSSAVHKLEDAADSRWTGVAYWLMCRSIVDWNVNASMLHNVNRMSLWWSFKGNIVPNSNQRMDIDCEHTVICCPNVLRSNLFHIQCVSIQLLSFNACPSNLFHSMRVHQCVSIKLLPFNACPSRNFMTKKWVEATHELQEYRAEHQKICACLREGAEMICESQCTDAEVQAMRLHAGNATRQTFW